MVNGHNDERNVPDERHTHSPAHDTDAEPSPETMTLADVANAQDAETEEYARVFLLKAMRLRGVAINREHFLRAELRPRGNHHGCHCLDANPSGRGSEDSG